MKNKIITKTIGNIKIKFRITFEKDEDGDDLIKIKIVKNDYMLSTGHEYDNHLALMGYFEFRTKEKEDYMPLIVLDQYFNNNQIMNNIIANKLKVHYQTQKGVRNISSITLNYLTKDDDNNINNQ